MNIKEKQIEEEILRDIEEMLPDCSGCTYDKKEGTHQYMSKQHFREFYYSKTKGN